MIGVIQRVLVDLVRERRGEAGAARFLADAGLAADFQFRIDTDYDDAQCLALFAAAGRVLDLPQGALFEAYADIFVRRSRVMFPAFYSLARSSREFLRRQPAIHNSFAAGLRDEAARRHVTDKFSIAEDGADLVTTYRSANGLCGLYRALATRVIADYGEEAEITDELCVARGDAHCRLRLHWTRVAPEGAGSAG